MKPNAETKEGPDHKIPENFYTHPMGRIFESGSYRPISVIEIAEVACPEHAISLKASLARLVDPGFPVIGVCGTINAGKSTLVSGFLSENGSRRVLSGDDSTERFTFWFPPSTRGGATDGDPIVESVRTTLDCEIEQLSESPEDALNQQNAAGSTSKLKQLETPLVAFDPALENKGVGFLDCPDVQKSADESISEETADLRLDALRRLSRVCSAFIVVTTDQGVKIERLGRILQTLEETGRELPVAFVYNMLLPNFDGEKKLKNVEAATSRWSQKVSKIEVFGAKFDGRESPRLEIFGLGRKGRLLEDFVAELEPSVLRQKVRASAIKEISRITDDLLAEVEGQQSPLSDAVSSVHETTTRFLSNNFIDDRGNLRPIVTPPQGAIDLLQSFTRTAPDVVTRTAFKIASPIQKLNELIAKGGGWLLKKAGKGLVGLLAFFGKSRLPQAFKERIDSLGKKVRPEAFRNLMKAQPFHQPEWQDETYDEVFAASIRAVSTAHFGSGLEDKRLDDCTRKVWKEVPRWKRVIFAAVFPVLVVTSVVIALASTVIDPSGLTGGIVVANLIEIISGSAIAYLVSSHGMILLNKLLEKDLAVPQLSDLHASLSDRMGVPRAEAITLSAKKKRKKLRPSQSELDVASPVLPVLEHPLIEFDDDEIRKLRNELESIEKAYS